MAIRRDLATVADDTVRAFNAQHGTDYKGGHFIDAPLTADEETNAFNLDSARRTWNRERPDQPIPSDEALVRFEVLTYLERAKAYRDAAGGHDV